MQPHDLQRFVLAQAPVYQQILGELKAGRKRSHWMWFVFPQIAGLGYSATARHYAISCRAEANAYLDHPVLGSRLRECAGLVVGTDGRTAAEIFGSPDDLKFHSSMTLFGAVATDNRIFMTAIGKYFGGVPDRNTIDRL